MPSRCPGIAPTRPPSPQAAQGNDGSAHASLLPGAGIELRTAFRSPVLRSGGIGRPVATGDPGLRPLAYLHVRWRTETRALVRGRGVHRGPCPRKRCETKYVAHVCTASYWCGLRRKLRRAHSNISARSIYRLVWLGSGLQWLGSSRRNVVRPAGLVTRAGGGVIASVSVAADVVR